PRHRERRALLLAEIMAGRRVEALRLLARDQRDDMRRVADIGEQDLVDRIERRAAPVHAAAGHRIDDRATRRRRRVEALIAGLREQLLASGASEARQQAADVIRSHALRQQRRHMGRKRLGRRQLLALGAVLRDRALLDRPHRLAGVAIEHEHKTLLGRLDHDIAHAVAGVDPRQRRLRRQVVVPDVVMHGLECPRQLAGLDPQRDHGIGVLVIAGALAAPEIGTRRCRRQEHQAP
ncbi:hypothetical protein chiPu_0030824, partial [Chiloscyllium punctatum]|nr:hypothetical protein [Chiloscyllium punctatum]